MLETPNLGIMLNIGSYFMRRTLKAGFSLFRVRVAEGLQYRFAAFSGATVSSFWALIEVVIITVFFTYGTNTGESFNGMSLRQGIAYIWMTQSLFGLLMWGFDEDIMNKITSGDVGIELCRPLDLYWHWFARSAAGAVSSSVLRGGFVFICGVTISLLGFTNIGAAPPVSLINFILFAVSLFSAVLFATAFRMFLTAIRLSIVWGEGPINIIMVFGGILSGAYLPLQLWPDFMQTFLRFQPFAAGLDTPVRFYAGTIGITDGLVSMGVQVFWIFIFVMWGKVILRNQVKNIIVQGG